MKNYLILFLSLSILSCGVDSNNLNEKKDADIDFKAELEKNLNEYQETYDTKVIPFKRELDSIKKIVKGIEFNNIVAGEQSSIDLKTNYVIASMHDYKKTGDFNIPPLDFVNNIMNKIRRDHFVETPTPVERRLKYLEDYYLDSNINYSDEKRLSIFNATTLIMEEYVNATYVLIIRDYLMLKPVVEYAEYKPGEVISGVFLFNRESGQIEDQFVVSAGNDRDLNYQKSGDVLKDNEVAKKRLDQMLKSNYDRELVNAISKRYALKEKPSIFF
jgi:hypothetical protein